MKSGQEQKEIEKVLSEKDLGVIMDKELNISEHISNKLNKANLYKSIVRPHLEYAVTVCTPLYRKYTIATENVQRRTTKLVSTISHLSYQKY